MQTVVERPIRIKEAAAFLGVSEWTIYQYIKKGLPFHQKPGSYGFLYPSEINDWIKGK
jgi:excisionase family DNA binding protein